MLEKETKILIIGLGLLGGSYARCLTNNGYLVYAIDQDQESIEYAIDNHIIIDGKTNVEKEFVEQFDLLIFCLYPKVFVEWIKKYQHFIKPNAILTDVTGVKTYIIKELENNLRADLEFIGSHPMAGREVYGVKNSRSDLFVGANLIITPTKNQTKKAISYVQEMGKILGFKNIVNLTPEEHDEMIGFLSQLTHCIAVSLMTCKDSKHLVKYTGDSFRDLTRIAKINENMWSELFLLNKNELLQQMNEFEEQFSKLKNALLNEDVEQMKDIMRLSTTRRSYFDKQDE